MDRISLFDYVVLKAIIKYKWKCKYWSGRVITEDNAGFPTTPYYGWEGDTGRLKIRPAGRAFIKSGFHPDMICGYKNTVWDNSVDPDGIPFDVRQIALAANFSVEDHAEVELYYLHAGLNILGRRVADKLVCEDIPEYIDLIMAMNDYLRYVERHGMEPKKIYYTTVEHLRGFSDDYFSEMIKDIVCYPEFSWVNDEDPNDSVERCLERIEKFNYGRPIMDYYVMHKMDIENVR